MTPSRVAWSSIRACTRVRRRSFWIWSGTRPAVGTLLLVGHDPAIQELALTLAAATPAFHLSGAAPPGPLDRMRAKFPTAAIAVFEFTGNWDKLGPGTARLTSFVTPRELAGRA